MFYKVLKIRFKVNLMNTKITCKIYFKLSINISRFQVRSFSVTLLETLVAKK